jgi:hypothetical protein
LTIPQGGWGSWNSTYKDTLGAIGTSPTDCVDTLFVIFPLYQPDKDSKNGNTADIPYPYKLEPYINIYFKTAGLHDTDVVTVTYWESMDAIMPTNAAQVNNVENSSSWHQVIYESAAYTSSGYSTTFTVQATAASIAAGTALNNFEFDFWRYKLFFPSRYLAVRLVSATKTSWKTSLKLWPVITVRNVVH